MMMYDRDMKRVLVAAAILIWAVAVAGGSKPIQPARLIKLNVVALDAQGQPVTGLHSADFQLQEDGKPRDIVFLRFTGGQAPPAKPAPGEYSNRAGAAPRATVGLIDLLSNRLMGDSTISREITDALKNLESSDDLYLYILTPRGDLYPIHPLPKPDTEVTPAAEPWTRLIAPLMQAAIKNLFAIKPVDDRDIAVRFNLTVKAMRELGGQMGEVSGRKNLVWVSHGFPIYGYSISGQGRLDFTKPLQSLCEGLQQAQIAVYTVDQSMVGAAEGVGTTSVETLQEFTDTTGGREYTSDRAGEAIQQARTDSRANYEIAYYSTSPISDGKHHKIRVTCARKEIRLQTEHGFYALGQSVSPGAPGEAGSPEVPMAIEAAAHSPFDATDIGLRANVSPDPAAPQNMRFDIHIDAADLLPGPARDSGAGKVSVVFAAYDEGLKQLSPPVPVSLTQEQPETGARDEITLREAIPVGGSVRRVRVIVFDAALGAVGSVTVPIQH
jgi:VWFA-related protein